MPKRKIMTQSEIINRINALKAEKNAIILAHYYTRPEVQDIADYLGDSLGLSREAGETDAQIIVFCGVHFMAETASIISPNKKVLIPAQHAGCSLAEGIAAYDLKQWKSENPDGVVVCYVNTTADVKAWSDYCCTSANAVKVVESIPKDKKILFVPDKNLGTYIAKITGREMEVWNGDCCVHERMDADMILQKLAEYPDAEVLVHPESKGSHDDRVLSDPRVFIGSTSAMIARAKSSPANRIIVCTELETIHKLKKDNPEKEFIPIHPTAWCGQMKKVTLEKVLEALEKEQYEVKVPEELRLKALVPIQRMLAIK